MDNTSEGQIFYTFVSMKSKAVDITISKSDVYKEIRTRTSYTAGKDAYNVSGESYDRISVAKADSILLDKYWELKAPSLLGLLRRYIFGSDKVVESSDSLKVELSMPMSYNETVAPSLVEACCKYMAAAIMSEWFKTANTDSDAGREQQQTDLLAARITRMLSERDMPVRRFGEDAEIKSDTTIEIA